MDAYLRRRVPCALGSSRVHGQAEGIVQLLERLCTVIARKTLEDGHLRALGFGTVTILTC